MYKVDIESYCFWAQFFHPHSPSSKLLLWHQTCKLRSYCFADTEHDVRALGKATAQKWGTRQKDYRSGGKVGLHPLLCPVATYCAFSSNNQATKGLPGWVGLQGPLPVILFEFWVLFSPCQAALCRTQHTRDPMQLIKLTLQLCSLSETISSFVDAASHLYSYTIHPWLFGLRAECYWAAWIKREEPLLEIVEKREVPFIHFLSSKLIMGEGRKEFCAQDR